MKTVKLTIAAALTALFAVSCTGSGEKKTEQTAPSEPAAEIKIVETDAITVLPDTVVVLADDALLRPDQAVPALTVIDCNAVWCVPCKKLTKPMELAANKYAGKVVFYSADFEKLPETAKAYEVTQVPTVIFQKPDGTMVRFDNIDEFLKDKTLKGEEATNQIFDNLCRVIDQNL